MTPYEKIEAVRDALMLCDLPHGQPFHALAARLTEALAELRAEGEELNLRAYQLKNALHEDSPDPICDKPHCFELWHAAEALVGPAALQAKAGEEKP